MNKTPLIIFSAAFVVGCLGLWGVLTLLRFIYLSRFRFDALPLITQLLLANKALFCVVPMLCAGLSIYFTSRDTGKREEILVHIGILAVVFSISFFLVALVVLLPLLPTR